MEKKNFKFTRGTTFSKYITIEGWKEEIDQLYFTMKINPTNKDYCLQKKLGDGIYITDSTEDSITINLTIDANDSEKLKCGSSYSYDLKIISGKLKTEVMTGTITLEQNVTLSCNEV